MSPFDSEDRQKEKVYVRTITQRFLPTYQLGRKLYKSYHAAANAEAWRMICEKYCKDVVYKLDHIKSLHGMNCQCEEENSDFCKIHNRQSGYLARLHRRLMNLILKDLP